VEKKLALCAAVRLPGASIAVVQHKRAAKRILSGIVLSTISRLANAAR
jgi:hypothetical protein